MPWKRYGNNSYYYRSVRAGNRVRTEYGGGGLLGEVMAEIDKERRTTRRELREADLHDVASFREEQESLGLDGYFRKVEDLAQTALGLAGYHRHDRGNWRKQRMSTSASTPALTDAAGQCEATSEGFVPSRDFLRFVDASDEEQQRHLDAARQGDPATLDWLRKVMVEDPSGQLIRMLGTDLPQRISRFLVARAAPNDPIGQAALLAGRERQGRELAGPEPSAMERVLGDRAALCWLNLHSLELQYEREKHNFGPELTETMERQIARANRRFNEACKTLATVQRKAVPAIKLFLGENQVNVLGGARTSIANGARRGAGHP